MREPLELTGKAIAAGLIGGVLFGSANAYLGLRVGLTVGTSIPIAILTVAAFRVLAGVLGRSGILEYNIAQTIGSATSSLATGLIFTVPALYIWGVAPSFWTMTVLALAGGVLGTLAMIPLRPLLIVQAHRELPYPEGTACAEVLRAAESGGARAQGILRGLGVGAAFKLLVDGLRIVPRHVSAPIPGVARGELSLEPSAALLGIGYILGYRVAAVMVGGGLLASAVLIPLIAAFGDGLAAPFFPETTRRIAEMDASQIWARYVRYIGAGAVAVAGILTVLRSLPTMVSSFGAAVRGFRRNAAEDVRREERDLPMTFVAGGFVFIVLMLAFVPGLLGANAPLWLRLIGAGAVAVFSFFFATVASRIVGLIGTTSNPVSGMTIVTMLGTTSVLLTAGVTGLPGQVLAITVGTVVCTAASIAGDVSQDLKTGFLVGATPRKQQISDLIGVTVAAPFIAGTLYLLASQSAFGTPEMPAPQATLLKTIVEGVLSGDLPWGLVLTGGALALVAELLGVPSLAFAVGIYLPLSTMTPIYVGGVLRRFTNHRIGASRAEGGVLFASGLVAGEGVLGVGIAAYAFFLGRPAGLGFDAGPAGGLAIGLGAVGLLAWMLYRSAATTEPPQAEARRSD